MSEDLPDALRRALGLLAAAPASRDDAFRTPTLATRALDGRPASRTVVLRRFDAAARLLEFHTDRRAAKVAEIDAEPRVALHAWDAAERVQIRIDGLATPHVADAVADAAWAALHPGGRAAYAVQPASGTAVPVPPPAPRDAEAGRGNFVAVTVAMEALEWLELRPDGQRRARFRFAPAGPEATWLVP